MMYRTKLQRDKEKHHWGYTLQIMDDMAERTKASPSNPLSSLQPSNPRNSLSHEDVRKIAREPIQSILPIATRVIANSLAKMNIHILCTSNNSGFITSDQPCVMLDHLHSGEYLGLGCSSIEITLPMSPKQLVIFFWNPGKPRECAYTEAKEEVVNEFNRRTRIFCDEYFVVNEIIKKTFGLSNWHIIYATINRDDLTNHNKKFE